MASHPHPHPHSHSHDHPHNDHHGHAHGQDDCCATPAEPHASEAGVTGAVFRIPTMDCAAEEGDIRRALDAVSGVRGLRFRLAERTLTIDANPADLPAALDAIRQAGYDPQPLEAGDAHGHDHGFGTGLPRLGAALALALGAEALSFLMPDAPPARWVGMALAAVAIGLAGLDIYKKGLAALRALRLNINALMTVAVTGAFVLGQWPEAAMVMALYALAELIEARAVDRARNAIQGLMSLAPETAEVRQADGSWAMVASAQVAVGAVVRLKPGERVPLDGVVTEGRSAVDQSPVTGESIPVDKAAGDDLYAGTINQAGALAFRTTTTASGSTLARIMEAVEKAQGSRAPTQRFVDRFAAVYTPAVFAIALAVALLGPFALGWTWTLAIYKALVLLVIACPCALVISTPVTVVSGLAAAARQGILIKGGAYLEQARTLRVVALDKTGTVTEGKPRLVHWEALSDVDPQAIAAALASRSDHPVSQAIAAGLGAGTGQVDAFSAMPGHGVQGRIDGQLHVLANHRFIHDRGLCSPALEDKLAVHEAQGRTVTLLATDSRVLGLFAVADTIKPSSTEAVAALRRLGVRAVMLTGDNDATARAIAAQAGIADARGNLLPQEKQAAVKALQASDGPTAMVGDGINDAPSLAQADIGFAMGGAGTHVAVEAADVVVMNDDLRRIATTIELSRKTHAVLWQNISLALGIKAVFLLLALAGNATMWMAVFADMGASLLVVANGLRLLRA
jgi:Cd2+/Zn2+-exporting ATPase